MLALDFDDGDITSNEAIGRLEKLGLQPNIIYYTFSHKASQPRFRLILLLDKKITDLEERQFFQEGLFEIFPSADRGCSDPAHFFYPGIEGFVYARQEIDTLLLENIIDAHIISSDSGQTRKITANSFLDDDYMVCRKVRGSINTINKGKKNSAEYETWLDGQRKNAYDFKKAAKRVQIFKDFVEGKWLHHPQLFGLATSLYWVQGGLKFMKDTMRKWTGDPSVETSYTDNNFHALKSVRKKQYTPQHLSNYSPYQEDWDQVNLIQAEKEFVRGVQRTEQIRKTTVDNAYMMFQHKFHEVLSSMDTSSITIFKLPTGLGKSEVAKDVNDCTIGAPTHDLKSELMERRTGGERTAIATPQLPEFESMELNVALARLYELGFSGKAYQKIIEVAHQAITAAYSFNDRNTAKEYINRLKEVYATRKTVFTTHQRAIHSDRLPHDTIIFDEDPLESLISVDKVKISDLQKLSVQLGEGIFRYEEDTIWDVVNHLAKHVKEGEITELPSRFDLDLEHEATALSQVEDLSSNLVDFLTSEHIYKEDGNPDNIFYVNKNELPEDKQIIILSATCPVEYYKELYGNRVQVVDISDVHQNGTIIQHTKKSYSRESLKNSLQEANEKTAGKPTLTFMNMVDKIDTAVDSAYFGNCEGYDSLKNTSINVLGTPHKHNSLYFLLGKILGMNVGPADREFGMTNIDGWNGFKFSFPTFKNNKRLQRLQLSLIEADLIQIVGRARCLREDVTVDVYSNLPLRQTDEFIHD